MPSELKAIFDFIEKIRAHISVFVKANPFLDIFLSSKWGKAFLLLIFVSFFGSMIWFDVSSTYDRRMHTDLERIADMEELRENVQKYYEEHEVLPSSVGDIEQSPHPGFIRDGYLYDPETNKLYDYKILSELSYQICAVFVFSSQEISDILPYTAAQSNIWEHQAGNKCFVFELKPKTRRFDGLQ